MKAPAFALPGKACGGFRKSGGTFLGVPIMRIRVFWGLYWGPPILGSFHIASRPSLLPLQKTTQTCVQLSAAVGLATAAYLIQAGTALTLALQKSLTWTLTYDFTVCCLGL